MTALIVRQDDLGHWWLVGDRRPPTLLPADSTGDSVDGFLAGQGMRRRDLLFEDEHLRTRFDEQFAPYWAAHATQHLSAVGG